MLKLQTIWIKIVIFFSIIIVLIIIHFFGILKPLDSLITYFFKPLQSSFYRMNLMASDPVLLQEKEQLISQNEDLKNQFNQAISENIDLKKQIEDQKELKLQMEYLKTNPLTFQPAKILNKTTTENAQIITINQGQNKKIVEGMAVVTGQGIIIGKVINAYPNTADVLLLTSNSSQIAAQIQKNENISGLITGKHGLSLEMQLIPKQSKIEKKDIVISSGIEKLIPKGLIIGQVDLVSDNPNDLFSTAQIIPFIDYSQLNIVSVIIS